MSASTTWPTLLSAAALRDFLKQNALTTADFAQMSSPAGLPRAGAPWRMVFYPGSIGFMHGGKVVAMVAIHDLVNWASRDYSAQAATLMGSRIFWDSSGSFSIQKQQPDPPMVVTSRFAVTPRYPVVLPPGFGGAQVCMAVSPAEAVSHPRVQAGIVAQAERVPDGLAVSLRGTVWMGTLRAQTVSFSTHAPVAPPHAITLPGVPFLEAEYRTLKKRKTGMTVWLKIVWPEFVKPA